jgi:hypothetical protein
MTRRSAPAVMIVDVAALMQQTWRAAKFFERFKAYGRSIGCTYIQDEVIADARQARLLAAWWTEHTSNG